ncbi:phage portal protein [Rhodobacter sp. TJ_12]|uniref:phage portal protein n=1 Tax=Rhodobacter sp. TJ_12 TaxID=2029399 RepID=UPI001CBD6AFC|nr:phage portal protein [Rhodobacter sp. TJ_12]MBZ4023258.1 phage portal protein [Rhodobacter sp. TJ_12]
MSLRGIFGRGRAAQLETARREPPLVATASASAGALSPAFEAGWQEVGVSGSSRVRNLPRVTPELAQKHATVVAACSVIAGDLAKLPLAVYQRNATGREVRVREHPVDHLLNSEASPGVPAHVMRFAIGYAFTLRGKSFAFAPRDGAGELVLVETIRPDRCEVLRVGRERFYEFEDGAQIQRRVSGRVMAHLRYMAEDGWTGRSPIEVAAETLGIALARQEAAARLAGGKGFKAVAKLEDFGADEETWQRSRARLKAAMAEDADDSVLIMGQSDDIKSLGLSAADLELLSSQKFDREQIAALYRVPPAKLQMLEHGVKANGEQQAIDYKAECLTHWGKFLETGMGQGLLTAGERQAGLFLRHEYDALLMATTKERYEAITKAVGGPILTPNEGREIEGLDAIEGGEKLYPPSNMTRKESGAQGDGD